MSTKSAKVKLLKIGIVCEGQLGCAETQVFPHLVKLLCPRAELKVVPTGNRPTVLAEAPKVAKRLFDEGCTTVFVIWDVFPEWRDAGGTTDCKQHRKDLDASVRAFGKNLGPLYPVAIHEELEAWLLCDADALMAVIGPLANKKSIPHEKDPDSVSDPKTVLRKRFKLGRGSHYNQSFSAGNIAKKLTTTKHLERSQSFKRFAEKIRALCVVDR